MCDTVRTDVPMRGRERARDSDIHVREGVLVWTVRLTFLSVCACACMHMRACVCVRMRVCMRLCMSKLAGAF